MDGHAELLQHRRARDVDSESFYAGSTHDRLREIRERFDPTELFRANHRIQPAGADW